MTYLRFRQYLYPSPQLCHRLQDHCKETHKAFRILFLFCALFFFTCAATIHTLWGTAGQAGYPGSQGGSGWTLPRQASMRKYPNSWNGRCFLLLRHGSKVGVYKWSVNISYKAASFLHSEGNSQWIMCVIVAFFFFSAVILTFTRRTELSKVWTTWVQTTTPGSRVQPVNIIVHPGVSRNSQVGSTDHQHDKGRWEHRCLR